MSATVFRVLVGILGVGLGIFGLLQLRWKRANVILPVALGALFLASLLIWAVIDPFLYGILFSGTPMARIRLGVLGVGVMLLLVTFEALRRTALKERYALLWIVPTLVILVVTLFPELLDWVQRVFGMGYASTMLVVIFLTMMGAVYILSKNLSRQEQQLAKIAQRCAILELRLRTFENQKLQAEQTTEQEMEKQA